MTQRGPGYELPGPLFLKHAIELSSTQAGKARGLVPNEGSLSPSEMGRAEGVFTMQNFQVKVSQDAAAVREIGVADEAQSISSNGYRCVVARTPITVHGGLCGRCAGSIRAVGYL